MTDDEIDELLPFRANGTLEGDELASVEAALAETANLRSELAVLSAIRNTMQAEQAPSPGDFGLARLMRTVEAEERTPVATVANDNVVPVSRLRIWQAAAVVVLAVGIGFALPHASQRPVPVAVRDAEPAASEGYSLASGGETADFTVAFAPDAREREIRVLLLDAGVEIVSGPSALGLYGLGLRDPGTSDAALEILAGAGIVEDIQ